MGEKRGAYRALVEKPEEKRPLGILRRRWQNNIKMYLQKVGWGHGIGRFGSRQGQLAGCCE
jgi:hypothetical protein